MEIWNDPVKCTEIKAKATSHERDLPRLGATLRPNVLWCSTRKDLPLESPVFFRFVCDCCPLLVALLGVSASLEAHVGTIVSTVSSHTLRVPPPFLSRLNTVAFDARIGGGIRPHSHPGRGCSCFPIFSKLEVYGTFHILRGLVMGNDIIVLSFEML
jgi:hypothetical protein